MVMHKINLRRTGVMILLASFLLLGSDLYAHHSYMAKNDNSYKQNAQKWTEELSQKVNLTKEQQTKIEGILVDYQKAESKTDMKNNTKLESAYNTQIESVLNDNQKKIYMDNSEQWWKNITSPAVKSEKQNTY
jgi:Spy/CpxP family protein refolding chaperone